MRRLKLKRRKMNEGTWRSASATSRQRAGVNTTCLCARIACQMSSAACSGEITQNVRGLFFSSSVSTKPGRIVSTFTPRRVSRLRSASR